MSFPIKNFSYDIFNIEKGFIEFSRYEDGQLAFQLYDTSEGYPELFAVPTINLADYRMFPAEGNVFIKNYSDGLGITTALVEAGVVSEPIRNVRFGPFDANANECRVLVEIS